MIIRTQEFRIAILCLIAFLTFHTACYVGLVTFMSVEGVYGALIIGETRPDLERQAIQIDGKPGYQYTVRSLYAIVTITSTRDEDQPFKEITRHHIAQVTTQYHHGRIAIAVLVILALIVWLLVSWLKRRPQDDF